MEELVYKLEEKNKICDFLRETNGKLIENNICLMNEVNYLKEIKHLPTFT